MLALQASLRKPSYPGSGFPFFHTASIVCSSKPLPPVLVFGCLAIPVTSLLSWPAVSGYYAQYAVYADMSTPSRKKRPLATPSEPARAAPPVTIFQVFRGECPPPVSTRRKGQPS